MERFVYERSTVRVVFAPGASLGLGEELRRLGASRVLLVGTQRGSQVAQARLREAGVSWAGSFDRARLHVPRDTVDEAVARSREVGADLVLAFGGGSPIGLAKAMTCRTGLPSVFVPTTYAGSEMTNIVGMTEDGVKRTHRDDAARARLVIYDPDLTATLPPRVAGPSGMNALAHAVEALYAHDRDPVTVATAKESMRCLARSLPRVVSTPDDPEARTDALRGAWLASLCLDSASIALHHKLCHVLGGTLDLSHAAVHAVMLPFAAAYNASMASEAMAAISDALGGSDAPRAIYDLGRRLGVPRSLRELGVEASALPRVAELALARPYPNPRPLAYPDILALLERAWAGDRP